MDSLSQISTIKIKEHIQQGKIISLSKTILKTYNKELKLEAVGHSISTLVRIVENLKVIIKGLHQQNKISSIYDKNGLLKPKLEITISLSIPKKKTNEGYQTPLSDFERRKIKDILISRKITNRRMQRNIVTLRGMRGRRILRGMRVRGTRGRRILRGMERRRILRGMEGRGILRGMRGRGMDGRGK